jgi:hypothetical protein
VPVVLATNGTVPSSLPLVKRLDNGVVIKRHGLSSRRYGDTIERMSSPVKG